MGQASSEEMEMDEKTFEGNWKVLGAGVFGQVWKARHHCWGKDVVIKLLGVDTGIVSEDMVRQYELMQSADSPYIMKVLGVFRGCPPYSNMIHVGVVLDLMERGSLDVLQIKRERQPLPWPLVFRLVHQVALGMNHLHSLTPRAIVHKDLEPGNILLDSDLNVKITDFGLAKFADTVTASHLHRWCTPFYSPPEVGEVVATCAYDVYSYAVLVWSILNPAYIIARDEESFPVRPSLEEVKKIKAPGLEELVELMVRCWNEDPNQRPTSAECIAVTGDLYWKNGWNGTIDDAVRTVQQELDGAPQPGPDHDQAQPGPDPNIVNNEFIQNLMDEKNWKVMDKNSFKGKWSVIGAGGGGQVFKARHRQWEKDVAVKIIGRVNGKNSDEILVREAKAMLCAESPYIVKVLGVFNGCTPHSPMISVGLVMEVMETGCLKTLQEKRERKPLPWPLVFRLVHQVALGMNYLHSLKPDALIHKDLKPENILLGSDLNVMITDFGIAKFANTVTALPGVFTPFFNPPEAEQGGATCAYDVYSYAIVVWTILNPAYVIRRGKESYPKRPSLVDVRKLKAPGLEELVDLMVRCWNQDRDQRPTFGECTAVTERLYEKNRRGIDDAVRQVQQELVTYQAQRSGTWFAWR